MNVKNIIFCLFFLILLNLIPDDFINNDDEIFFNILYSASLRSIATIEYFINFIDFDNTFSHMHKEILSRMRNPSKLSSSNNYDNYKLQQEIYLNLVEKTIQAYDLYKIILNNYFDLLNKEKIAILEKQKQTIALSLLSKIISLENIISLVNNFFHRIENFEYNNKYNITDLKNSFNNISNQLSLYFYYQKMYVAFDHLLIKQYDFFIKLKELLNSYYKEFWLIIEEERLKEIIHTYNHYMTIHIKNNNKKIKEIKLDKEKNNLYFGDNLPDILYNPFL